MATNRTYSLVGQSPPMDEVRRLVQRASRNRVPVLLLGETGTGKDVVARAIHQANPRGQFVPIDCGSLVGTLMESELFGHTKGAFSGAVGNKKGLVELADGGTAFFDEIGDLPLEMQVKLLRLIQEREFRAVGSLEWKKVDLRIIAATHRDLKKEVEARTFRQDLYFRLNVVSIRLPALRDRREDIPLLIEHFLKGLGELGLSRVTLSQEILQMLLTYDWPGNVRELKHCIERLGALSADSGLRITDLPSALSTRKDKPALPGPTAVTPRERAGVQSIHENELETIRLALESTKGRRREAARLLGIGRTTLYRKLKDLGLG